MALDPVPWFMGGGAAHSAATARNLAWNATGGKTGIATPTSLQVRQLPTPGAGVQVMPGGGMIESVYAGALQQSYTVRNDAADTVSIPVNQPTQRTYWVTVEVNDPTYAGQKPPSTKTGPYVFWRQRTTRQSTHPELLLAKVVVPADSPSITNSMITDMRTLANPKRQTVTFARPRIAADNSNQNYLNGRESNGGEFFPGGAGYSNEVDYVIPDWAVSVIVEADWMSVGYVGGQSVLGRFWIEFGDEYKPHTWPYNRQYEYATQQFRFNAPTAGNDIRLAWRLMDVQGIAKKLRGENTTFVFKSAITDGSPTNAVYMDSLSGLGLKLTFLEEPADWEEFN